MGTYFSHDTTGGGGGGGAVTIADGANVVEGATTDAAVTGDNPGTISAKLRGLTKILTDVWDSVNHLLKISGTVTANAGTNLNTSGLALEAGGHLASLDTKLPSQGQALAAASVPVVLTAAQITTLTPPTTVTANQGSANATPWNVNEAQIAGNASAVNAGTSSSGTRRVVQATAAVVNITQVTVPTTAGGISLIAANANRLKLRVTNTGTNPVYVFNTSSPTTANGDFIPGIAGYPWISRYEGQLWAIASGGSQVVTVYEESSA